MLNTLTGCERYYLVSRGTLVTVRLTDDRDIDPLSDSSLYALISRANSADLAERGARETLGPFVYSDIIPLLGECAAARGLKPVGTNTRKAVPRFKPPPILAQRAAG